MPQYLSPGVYVEETPSAIRPIAGVSTSTAAFIGIVPDSFPIPPSVPVSREKAKADGTGRAPLKNYPVSEAAGTYQIQLPAGLVAIDKQIVNDHDNNKSYAKVSVSAAADWATKTVANAKSKLRADSKDLPLEFQAGEQKPAGADAGTYRISIKKERAAPQATGAKIIKGADNSYAVLFSAPP